MFFVTFCVFFLNLITEIDGKSCLSVKKNILINERHAKHLFAGRNTQHVMLTIMLEDIHLFHLVFCSCSNQYTYKQSLVKTLETFQVNYFSFSKTSSPQQCG